MTADDPDSRVGSVVDGRYRILERIAHGGMGVVYKAERVPVGRPVAVKFLHALFANDPDSRSRFERETRALCKLTHPNCVSIIDFGVDDAPYLVMDHVSGTTLRDLIDEGPLAVDDAIAMARQLLAGLAHAHAEGIVHRDVKPANVMVSEQIGTGRHVRILDFGLARLRGGGSAMITQSNVAVGTPSYMAPEQTVGGETDARTDIYAVGALLFEMLTGDKPFIADDTAALLDMHRSQPPPHLHDVMPERKWPVGLDAVVQRALAKLPGDRWPSAVEFAEALDRVQRGDGRALTTAPVVPEGRGSGRAIVLAMVLVAVIAAAAWFELRKPKSHGGEKATTTGSQLTDTTTEDASRLPEGSAAAPVLAPDAAAPAALLADAAEPFLADAGEAMIAVPTDAAVDAEVDAAIDAPAIEVDAAAPDADESADELGSGEAVAPADPEGDPVQATTDEPPVPTPPVTVPKVAAAPPRTVNAAMALIKQGRREEAISALRALWKQQKRNANIPFVLGNLYHDKGWYSVAIQHYQAAISTDKRYARNGTLIRNLIDMLAASSTRGKASYVLKKTIGAAARPSLQYAAKHHGNATVRRTAAALLRR